MHFYSLLLYICFILIFGIPCNSQVKLNNTMLGTTSRVYLDVPDTTELIALYNKGVRTFAPVCKGTQTKKWLKTFFKTVNQLHTHSDSGTIVLLNLHCDAETWDNQIQHSPLSVSLKKNKASISELFTLNVNEKNSIAFNLYPSDYNFALGQYICLYNKKQERSKQELKADFLLTHSNLSPLDSFPDINYERYLMRSDCADTTGLRSLLSTWISTGKRPHFIKAEHKYLNNYKQLVKELNNIPYRSAHFKKGKDSYAPVAVKEYNNFLSGGRVCFPSPNYYGLQITPQSKGHRFSPDIFMFTPEHNVKEILIRTFPFSLAEKQVAHFHFNNADNPCSPDIITYFTSTDSLLVKDDERGFVYTFDGLKTYIDCGTSLDINYDEPISISTWIKPLLADNNHSIIGIGRSFSFKIRNNQLTFTRAGIKDTHFSGNTIELNTWQHIAAIFEPNRQVSLFLNGKKIGQEDVTEIVKSNHSLLIGSNIWGEYYKGLMDDLKIWNRALSDDEITAIYNNYTSASNSAESTHKWWFIVVIPVLILVLISVLRKKKVNKQGADSTVKEVPDLIPLAKKKALKACLLTFGEFRIYTDEGQNIVAGLSPKEKQLFLYLLWHTLRSTNGGVSSRRMSDDLWPGMPADKAKNNRSTYMQRLRKQITDCTGIQLIYAQNKKWRLEIPANFRCDLTSYQQAYSTYIKDKQPANFKTWLQVISDGAFLPETHNEVIDVFKNEIENEIINTLTASFSIDLASKQHDTASLLISTIRQYDPLNEPALALELRWLSNRGQHGRAMDAFQRFSRDYEMMYGEKLNKEMNDLML